MVCFERNLAHKNIWYKLFCWSGYNWKTKSYARNYMLSCDFKGFFSVFGTFAHKVAQTLFDFHETWHTTLFGIYYYVEVVRIENHSLILEIKC